MSRLKFLDYIFYMMLFCGAIQAHGKESEPQDCYRVGEAIGVTGNEIEVTPMVLKCESWDEVRVEITECTAFRPGFRVGSYEICKMDVHCCPVSENPRSGEDNPKTWTDRLLEEFPEEIERLKRSNDL